MQQGHCVHTTDLPRQKYHLFPITLPLEEYLYSIAECSSISMQSTILNKSHYRDTALELLILILFRDDAKLENKHVYFVLKMTQCPLCLFFFISLFQLYEGETSTSIFDINLLIPLRLSVSWTTWLNTALYRTQQQLLHGQHPKVLFYRVKLLK